MTAGMIKFALICALISLGACGPTGQAAPAAAPVSAPPDPDILAAGRRVLAEGGKPVISVADPSLGLATFMVPLGENAGITTWANPEYQTIALRRGVILATRGFGRDLMSADAPSAQQLSLGAGQHRRVFYVLDGADQTQALTYDCRLSVSNNETIDILGVTYPVRHVLETCSGGAGNLVNSFWFDHDGLIRQSRQTRFPGVENLLIQAVID